MCIFTLLCKRLPRIIQTSIPLLSLFGTTLSLHTFIRFNFLELLGATLSVITSYLLFSFLCKFFYRNWLGVWLGHNTDLKSLGSWAVVTGATKGIGRAYALALAERGMNVVLISRSPESLEKVKAEVTAQHDVKVKVISVDFTKGCEIYPELQKQLSGLEIGVLINNVGMGYDRPEYFGDVPDGPKFCQDMIHCNTLSMAMMTYLILPGMVERKKGAIVNVGSISSAITVPFMSLYTSSKVFVEKFTQTLELEYRSSGILFQVVIPGYVVSNMSKIRKSTYFVPTPEAFVEKALNSIGLQRRTAVWSSHQLLYFVYTMAYICAEDTTLNITHYVMRKVWFYGKKVQMIRSKKNS